ncbi:MAG: ribonuclease III [Planctomycetota bacterium]|nr:ribonuclease III [Planctomycetota bacterium]
MEQDRIADLEVLLGFTFRDKSYLLNALSHSSIKSEEVPSNERMEFLGDAVLGLILSEALYRRFPNEDEGVLTRIKSHAVSRATLERIAAAMALDRFILVGKGVRKRAIPSSLLGNMFEALVGAIYLDSGLAAVRKFILRHLQVVVNEIVEDRAEKNYKSTLQQYCQREQGTVPVYKVMHESGSAHSRTFEVIAKMHSKEWGRAKAGSKKEAEQGAARAALIHLKAIDEKESDSVRGAGTLLPTPGLNDVPAKKKTRRGGRGRRRPSAEKTEAGAEAVEAPKAETKKKTRRSRGRKKSTAQTTETPSSPPTPAPANGEGAPRRRRRRRRRAGSGAKGSDSAVSQ